VVSAEEVIRVSRNAEVFPENENYGRPVPKHFIPLARAVQSNVGNAFNSTASNIALP
jgi:hypothetical protein